MKVRDQILEVLDVIRPALRSDGGDVEFIGFDESEGVLQLRFLGACGDCPISDVTLRQGIERRIFTAVPEVREVRAF
ncbi:MAG TPA: NifU family protein [Longimicrobiales bacterium]|nr:NifU family protein [Longimicrobiales bacterium]